MPREILIHCEFCDGRGKAPLSPLLAATLRAIPLRGTRTADQLSGKLGATREAVNMRLLDLKHLKLVTRDEDGPKPWKYSRTLLK